MKTLITIIAVLAIAGAAVAQETHCYGWEDGGTALGEYGLVAYSNDGTHVSEGSSALAVAETGAGTGQIYGAFIYGVQPGDEITVSFDVYDDTAGTNPSVRIWGHYTSSADVNAFAYSAGGNSTYSDGLGWNTLSQTWIMPVDAVGLVVEIRPYGTAPYDQGSCWVDNLCVTAPAGATIMFPGGTVPSADSSWSSVKALFR